MHIKAFASRATTLYLSPTSLGTQVRKHAKKVQDDSFGRHLADSSNSMILSQSLVNELRVHGLNPPAQRAVQHMIALIAEHAEGSRHAEITDKLREIGAQKNLLFSLGDDRLFTLTRAARAAGLFAASGPFEDAALQAFGARAGQLRGLRGHLQRARFALAVGDVEQAARHVEPLKRITILKNVTPVQAIVQYIALVAGDTCKYSGAQLNAEGFFERCVANRTVLIYGPGPTEFRLDSSMRDALVARVLMPSVTWNEESDLADNRVDFVYANGETISWLSSLAPTEFREVVSRYSVLVLKDSVQEGRNWPAAHHATVACPRPAFVDGSPNMAPIIIWDLLLRGAREVHAIGASFFLGAQAYRKNQLRLNVDSGKRKDSHGSTGQQFEVCRMLAKHNATAGRQFVRNLMISGRVSGDSGFTRALQLSNQMYLSELDELYGVPRI